MKLIYFNLGKEQVQHELKLSDCFCFAFKSFLMQGWSKTPESYQNRIAFVCVMIAGMVLYWHWEAMIISYLSVNKEVIPYESFEQLLSASNDKVWLTLFSTELKSIYYLRRWTKMLILNKLFIISF